MKLDMATILTLTIIAYVISVFVTRFMAVHHVISDVPNMRSSHKVPTPRSGGLGIYIVFLFISLVFWVNNRSDLPEWFFPFVLPAILIGAHSLYDDITGRSAIEKLLVQLLAATVVVSSGC